MSVTLAIDYISQETNHKFHLPISVFKKPSNTKEYAKLEKILDKLIDEVRDNEKHPLAMVMQIIGDNLEQYDNEHYPAIGHDVSEIDLISLVSNSNYLN